MNNDITKLRVTLRRWTLVLGVAQITLGCLVGLIPPSAVPWFRGIVMAHIQFTVNGILMVAFGFLVPELYLRATALKAWFALLQIGTWSNGAAGVVGGLLGYASVLMPTIAAKFPAPAGPDHWAVTGLLQLCGLTILLALGLTLWGLLKRARPVNAG
jgi:membrane associated rhomboid family serine protease